MHAPQKVSLWSDKGMQANESHHLRDNAAPHAINPAIQKTEMATIRWVPG
jgi:hypothetical protein